MSYAAVPPLAPYRFGKVKKNGAPRTHQVAKNGFGRGRNNSKKQKKIIGISFVTCSWTVMAPVDW